MRTYVWESRDITENSNMRINAPTLPLRRTETQKGFLQELEVMSL